jgi:hypothetical protein
METLLILKNVMYPIPYGNYHGTFDFSTQFKSFCQVVHNVSCLSDKLRTTNKPDAIDPNSK